MVVALALSGVLATAMVPYIGPAAQRLATIVGPGAPNDLAPALPAAMVGDQYYDWSRTACIASGGVTMVERVAGEGERGPVSRTEP